MPFTTIRALASRLLSREKNVQALQSEPIGQAVENDVRQARQKRSALPENFADLGDLEGFHGEGSFDDIYARKHGADPLTTPLHVSVCYEWLGHFDVVKDIVGRGVDLNAQDGAGDTALHLLADHLRSIGNSWSWAGTIEWMKLMIRAGADPLIRNKAGELPMDRRLDEASEARFGPRNDEHAMTGIFLRAVTRAASGEVENPHDFVADPNAYRYQQSWEHTSLGALYRACEMLDLDGVRAALNAGADLNVRDVELDDQGRLDGSFYYHPVDVVLQHTRSDQTTTEQIRTMREILDVMIDAGLDQDRLARWAEGRMCDPYVYDEYDEEDMYPPCPVAGGAIGRILAKVAVEAMAEASIVPAPHVRKRL